MILRTARDAWILGLLCMFIPLGISYTLFSLLKSFLPGLQGGWISFTLCGLLSSSFLSDIANAMDELNLLTSELGQLAMSSAMINDVIEWILLAIMIISKQIKSPYSIEALLLSGVFLIITLYGVRLTILWIIKTTPEGKAVHQNYVIAILIQALVMGAISDALGLGFLPGVTLLGLFIPNGLPIGAAIIEKAELIVNEIFLPFFYLLLGRVLDITEIRDWKEVTALLLTIISVYLAKFLAVCLLSLYCKMRVRHVLLLGLILNLKGALKFMYFIRLLMRQVSRFLTQFFLIVLSSHLIKFRVISISSFADSHVLLIT